MASHLSSFPVGQAAHYPLTAIISDALTPVPGPINPPSIVDGTGKVLRLNALYRSVCLSLLVILFQSVFLSVALTLNSFSVCLSVCLSLTGCLCCLSLSLFLIFCLPVFLPVAFHTVNIVVSLCLLGCLNIIVVSLCLLVCLHIHVLRSVYAYVSVCLSVCSFSPA